MKIFDIDGKLIFEDDATTIKATVQNAVDKDISLARANLRGADLEGAYLERGIFVGADLGDASCKGTHFVLGDNKANLVAANLVDARLGYADLMGADMSGSAMTKENLENIRNIITYKQYEQIMIVKG